MQTDDDELMQRIKKGDMQAFDELALKWEHKLLNLVFKIVGDLEIAKDVRQEVFLRVFQKAKQYKSAGFFSTWLYRIAVNCSIDELKKRKRHKSVSLETQSNYDDADCGSFAETLLDSKPTPYEVAEQNEIADYVRNALSRLSNDQRVVIVLKHYEGLKFREIASILGCPVGTVKSRMYFGLDQLRQILKPFL